MVNKSVNCWTCQNVPRPQNLFFGLEHEKYGNQVPVFDHFEKPEIHAQDNSVQNGSNAFPIELVRFGIEAKPIWENIQTHRKNVITI